jgi:hypothetical protein
MKTPYALASFLFLWATPAVQGQIVFEAADLPVIGDNLLRYRDTVPAFGPGGSGPMQQWDFSAALPHQSVVTSVVAPASTPNGGSFRSSNLAMTEDNSSYFYFDLTSSALTVTGMAGDLLGDGQNLVVPFNPVRKVHDLPRMYATHFTNAYYFQAIADGAALGVHSIRLRHRGTVYDSTDAYGRLTTPIGTYDALRVKTTEYSVDSLWYRLIALAPWTFYDVLTDTTVLYSWLAKETKLPVAEMSVDEAGQPTRFVYSDIPPNISTGISGRGGDGVHIMPQPAVDGFMLDLGGSGRFGAMEVTTSDGRLVRTIPLNGNDRQWVPTTDWPGGTYLLSLSALDGGMPLVRRVMVLK